MAAGNVTIDVPRYVLSLRYSQIILAIIILGISANGIYWISFASWGFALFMSIATFIIALYSITTQTIRSWSGSYNYWAILALDIFGVIFWLSAMGALAATRAIFVVPTTIDSCTHTDDGGECDTSKVRLLRRDWVASDAYLASMSAAAGLAAIEMIFFAVTLTIFGIHLARYRSSRQASTLQTGYKLESGGLPGGDVGGGGGTGGYTPLVQPQQQYVVQQSYGHPPPQQPQQEQYWESAPPGQYPQHMPPPQQQQYQY